MLSGLLCTAPLRGQTGDDASRKPIVLVPPFENQSKLHQNISYEVATGTRPSQPKRRYQIDRLTEAPRSVLEDQLGRIDGLTILERQRVDAVLVETEFGLSGLVDPEKAIRLGKMLGANLIIMGSIIDIRDDTVEFQGYGVRTRNTKVTCQMRIRLVDIETARVRFSKIVKGSKTFTASTFGRQTSSDRGFEAVEAALGQLEGDMQFQAALFGRKPAASSAGDGDGSVEVEFAPKPENCDIEIDGKYVGGSPLKRRLPAGKELKIHISKSGYKDWEGVIVPEKGLRVTRELGPGR